MQSPGAGYKKLYSKQKKVLLVFSVCRVDLMPYLTGT